MKNLATLTLGVTLATMTVGCGGNNANNTTANNTGTAVNNTANSIANTNVSGAANDALLLTKVKAALATTNDIRDSTINVDVAGGVVTLNGTVRDAKQSNAALLAAQGVEGVTRVNNQLRVAPNDSMLNTNGNMNGNNRNR